MRRSRPFESAARLLVCSLLLVVGGIATGGVTAQVEQGATLTILRGRVAILHPDGSAVQPAPSGSTVSVGDEIRTVGPSGALITFFSGTEIEMGEETILVVEQLSRQGDRIDVSLRQVLGATVNRVQSLAGTGSTYQIQAGGAVALVRGTTFAMVGPVRTAVGNVVTIACKEDCTSNSTFAGCAMGPNSGIGVVTGGGKSDSGCVSFAVGRTEGLFDAAVEGVTTTEQHVQSDTRGVPAGQVAPGQRQEVGSRLDQQARQGDKSDEKPTATPSASATPSATPTGTPVATATPTLTPTLTPTPNACNAITTSGGTGVTTTQHNLGRTSGTFNFRYEAFTLKDRFQVIYQGVTLLDTGLVAGGATIPITYSGTSTVVMVTVTGPDATTEWNYTVGCPT